MKDNFSIQPENYAAYRPSYPVDLFKHLGSIISCRENAWDCGTGNGQAAERLAGIFNAVYATDISSPQIENAIQLPNVYYSVQAAEHTNFKDHFFDLIITAQAIHWFDFDRFYTEVRRTAKHNGLLVITGYGLCKINADLDAIISDFYHHVVGSYWDKERKYLDENYQTIPFPFEELPVPAINNQQDWTLKHFVGYLKTWSAVKHYTRKNNKNPVDIIYENLKTSWGEIEKRIIDFPLLLRIGRISKT